MKLLMHTFSLIFLIHSLSLSIDTAKVSIKSQGIEIIEVPKLLNGGFLEFLNDFVNGSAGLWAQEFLNRGFDEQDGVNNDVAKFWSKYFIQPSQTEYSWKLMSTGYNENGIYYQKITNNFQFAPCGVSQKVFLTDSVPYIFYGYFRGESKLDKVKIRVEYSDNNGTVFEDFIEGITKEWQKRTLLIPPVTGSTHALFSIIIDSQGYLDIDEVSLMPANNINGVRYDYYKLYENWKPGILRYPGGGFADTPENKLQWCIGDNDKRKSPNLAGFGISQRMDFGLNEFLQFCRSLGIEPHITLNFANGTPEEAADYVEYCNGSTETQFGKLRETHGYSEPWKIKYWEIGNEQWGDENAYASKYLEFYDAVKAKDSSVIIMIDGNHWNGYNNFDKLMSVAGKKCQIFGYHPVFSGKKINEASDSIIYLSQLAGTFLFNSTLKNYEQWLTVWALYPDVKQGLTEWWTDYGTTPADWIDTNIRNSSLESALVHACLTNSLIRNAKTVALAERTIGLGFLKGVALPNSGIRKYFGTSNYQSYVMHSRHTGDILLDCSLITPMYSIDMMNSGWTVDNVPCIDAVATTSSDTVYISLVNRNISDSILINFNWDFQISSEFGKIYELSSNHYLDANDEYNPYHIIPKQKNWSIKNELSLPPHSFVIIAIPAKNVVGVMDSRIEIPIMDIYPNPFSNFINISNKHNIRQIYIYNLFGINIYSQQIPYHSDLLQINTEHLNKGVYMFRSVTSNQYFEKILIKN